jgi:hypothetical protein
MLPPSPIDPNATWTVYMKDGERFAIHSLTEERIAGRMVLALRDPETRAIAHLVQADEIRRISRAGEVAS